MTPSAFVESICVDGVLPEPLLKLVPFCFERGEEMCAADFKIHLCEYVSVILNRKDWTKEQVLEQAKTLYGLDLVNMPK